MLDKHVVPLIKPPLINSALWLHKRGIKADQVTTAGFFIGLTSIFFVAINQPLAGLAALLLNRLADGIDGELARLQTPTDGGAFLDITLDFIFYALFPVGFAIAQPEPNALPAAL
ncbi:MAG: CDP-alcohol phosphatidyltransferase family protein, partial [Pseudomonadota bacterium]